MAVETDIGIEVSPPGFMFRRRTIRRLLTAAAVVLSLAVLALIPDALAKHGAARVFDTHQRQVVNTTASITNVDVTKDKNGVATRITLMLSNGYAQDVALSDHEDLSGSLPDDRLLPAQVWNGDIIRYQYDGVWRITSRDPDDRDQGAREGLAVLTLLAVLAGRAAAHWRLHPRVNHDRFFVGDLVLILLVATTIVAAMESTPATAILAVATIVVLALSVTLLPRLRWVTLPSPRRPDPPAEPGSAPHPEFDMTKRPVSQRLW